MPSESNSEGTECPAQGMELDSKGSECPAQGMELNSEGTECLAQGTELDSNGTECSAQGSESNSEGTECPAQGMEFSSEGSESDSKGPECSAQGSESDSMGLQSTPAGSDTPFVSCRMFDPHQLLTLVRRLPETRVDDGLSGREIAAVHDLFGFHFPEDLQTLLMAGLPVGPGWPDWRAACAAPDSADAEHVSKRLAWPLDGMLFDVEENSFWDPSWGARPDDVAKRRAIVTAAVRAAPVLIPVYAHRFLPAEPLTAGNPVLSVYQTDIIVYGRDLSCYLEAELGSREAALKAGEADVRCWTRWMLAEWTN